VGCGAETDALPTCDLSGPHVVVATTDFRVGALAAVTPDGCVADRLSSTSGDAVVRATDERLWVLNRTGGDALLAYPHGDYQTPELELGAYRHDNPHDLVRVGDQIFLSLYDRAELVVLDAADGAEVGRIDLSDHADADGVPEADALLVHDGMVYVALQRLDRNADWAPSGPGALLRIDPVSLGIDAEWETDENPKMVSFGLDIAVMSGSYFEPDGLMEVLDTHMTGPDAWRPVFTEADVGLDLGGGAAGVALGTSFDVGGDSVIGCVVADTFTEAHRGPSWFAHAVDGGTLGMDVLVAAREGFAGDGGGGLFSVEPSGCGVTEVSLPTLLEPFSLAVVP